MNELSLLYGRCGGDNKRGLNFHTTCIWNGKRKFYFAFQAFKRQRAGHIITTTRSNTSTSLLLLLLLLLAGFAFYPTSQQQKGSIFTHIIQCCPDYSYHSF